MAMTVSHPQRSEVVPSAAGETLWRLPEVERCTALKKTHIYALVKKGEFPAPIKLGARASAWLASEVSQWVQDRIEASRAGGE